jgi:hypothetical protein
MVTPMMRLSVGIACATRLMIAGSEIAVHEMKKMLPTRTAHQVGTRITTRSTAWLANRHT